MREPDPPADISTIACGLLTAAMGLFLVLQTAGLLGLGGRSDGDAPAWVGVCAGFIFIAGGIAVVLQSLPVARRGDDGPPRWVRSIVLALSLTILGGLAAIGCWIAFGPGERHFQLVGTFTGSGKVDDLLGRIVFGAGAVTTVMIFVIFAVTGVRRVARTRR
jgi:hypothetical protein